MSSSGVAIKTSRLTKFYETLKAVNEIDLDIHEGEIFGLLGPNGAGTTTTIRILAGILKPTFGNASVIGLDVVKDSLLIREKVGLLTENPSIYERLSVRHNLSFIAEIYGIPKELIQNKIEEIIELFDIEDKIDDSAGTLSKGMKQKVAIARAMIHDPDVLFLDEPTAALAPESAKIVRDQILKLAKEKKRTIFIATHNLDEAERLCDRVAIINKGKIVALGAPKELSSNMTGEVLTEIKFASWSEVIETMFNTLSVENKSIDKNSHKI